ncbi:hypothetical protein EXN66_Car011872 [Channa argus]|uniref:Uncharacterized protein n=1 Tax=Channa argus TaxID=215402 RepID=A0A6G1Q1W2_CHAAH|nr:hypothetical protein EXN66_Car011872 [Channa argus]
MKSSVHLTKGLVDWSNSDPSNNIPGETTSYDYKTSCPLLQRCPKWTDTKAQMCQSALNVIV